MSSTAPLAAREVRRLFPALGRAVGGRTAAYLDAPGGTQMPDAVIDAIAAAARRGLANTGGQFVTSRETGDVIDGARAAVADLLGCESPDLVIFGQNMTSLTYACSRALARTWAPGSNIVLTHADHDANVSPWLQAAAEQQVEVRWVDIDPSAGCTLDMGSLDAALDAKTALVAFTHAANSTGTVSDVARIVEAAHAVGAKTYVDAVHYAPHGLVDVAGTGTDWLVCSAYKFYGPHVGILTGTRAQLEAVAPYKLRPAPTLPPYSWEVGTQSYEALAGVTATVEYLASLAGADVPAGAPRRSRLARAYARIGEHECVLSSRFLERVAAIPGVLLHGLPHAHGRTPTFALDVCGLPPAEVAAELGERGIFVWHGHYYAVETMRRLRRDTCGGLVRVGFAHYNTADEVDAVCDELARISRDGLGAGTTG